MRKYERFHITLRLNLTIIIPGYDKVQQYQFCYILGSVIDYVFLKDCINLVCLTNIIVFISQDHLIFHNFSVFVKASFQTVYFPLRTDPQLFADHSDQSFVVTDKNNATLKVNSQVFKYSNIQLNIHNFGSVNQGLFYWIFMTLTLNFRIAFPRASIVSMSK